MGRGDMHAPSKHRWKRQYFQVQTDTEKEWSSPTFERKNIKEEAHALGE